MIAFEISHNGQRHCTAGVGEHGVLSAIVTWTLRDSKTLEKTPPEHREEAAREDLRVEVGGLADGTHYSWPTVVLHPGDEVLVRICETTTPDAPSESRRDYPDRALASQREYVRRMCQQWGWTLTEA